MSTGTKRALPVSAVPEQEYQDVLPDLAGEDVADEPLEIGDEARAVTGPPGQAGVPDGGGHRGGADGR